MTKAAKEFVEANKNHLVYAGQAIGNGGQGVIYTLTNEKSYQLSVEDCKSLPMGYPKWIRPASGRK